MSRKVVISIIVILGIILGGFMLQKNSKPVASEDQLLKASTIEEAWIEIKDGAAFLKNIGQGVELKDGDPLKKGVSIETGRSGDALIYFPDGSVIRLDKESSIKIDDVYFRRSDGLLTVRTTLSFGRAWVKLSGLASENSTFEIKTTNITASTKNGAFGIGYKNSRSWVLVNENNVLVSPIDPITKENIRNAEVTVNFGAMIEIGSAQIKEAVAATAPGAFDTKPFPISATYTNDLWVQRAKRADDTFNKEISLLKQGGDAKSALEKSVVDTRAKQLVFQPELKTAVSHYTDNTNRTINIATSTQSGDSLSGSISIETKDSLNIKEGDSIKFSAVLTDNNGDKKDITNMPTWTTTGQIGEVTQNGVFVAKLGAEVSELGEATGFVVGEIKNSSGADIRVTSNLISVKASVSISPEYIGGQ